MENIRTIGYWSLYRGLVSDEIANIEKGINQRWIITNVVLPSGFGIAVCWTRSNSDSILIEKREMKDKNNVGGQLPPSNNIFLR